MAIPQKELEFMRFGKWAEIWHAYREIYNFEAKQMLYADIEDEIAEYTRTHQKEVSILSL